MSIFHVVAPPTGSRIDNATVNNLVVEGTFIFDGVPQTPGGGGVAIPLNEIAIGTGSSIVGSTNMTYVDGTSSLTIDKPSTQATVSTLLTLTSDPAGDHGFGSHIAIDGNPGGGGTIFRTDGGLYDSTLQIYGGCDATGTVPAGSQIYMNGNNSTGSYPEPGGGLQLALGQAGASIEMLDPSYNIMMGFKSLTSPSYGTYTYQTNIPNLGNSALVAVDASNNLIPTTRSVFNYYSMLSNTNATGNGSFAAAYEVGLYFTPVVNVSANALKFFRAGTMTSPSHTLHLWAVSGGTLLASSATSNEISGQWNTAGITAIALTAGTQYCVSMGLETNGNNAEINTGFTYGTTYNHSTPNGLYYASTTGSFPASPTGATYFMCIDLDYTDDSPNLLDVGGSQVATSAFVSPYGAISGASRNIFGIFTTSGSSLVATMCSNGIQKTQYNSAGQYTIFFDSPFRFPPAITATIIENNSTISSNYLIFVGNITVNSFSVYIVVPTVVFVDLPFCAHIIGF